ncbi:TetR/AcrR family transcriptional regulator [Sciscionella marina]|uniref:TetR/AcrR family transcriptional regulator n=1 Tax=Sciscionella marina TaxID=508770 RepID=UPI000366B6D9|nr:TetR/AcrR family transcriptional regulator [Sciscionella marina]
MVVAAERRRAAHLGPERRRPAVLDAALAIAVEQGLASVSIAAVAERLAITRPVVYACFATREELLATLLEREERALLDGVLEALEQDVSGDPERVFATGFTALLATVAEHRDSWRLVFAAAADPLVAQRFARARTLVASRAAELFGIARGQTGDRVLPVLVEQFMSMGEGAVRSLVHGEGEWTAEELGALVGRMAYRAFQPEED